MGIVSKSWTLASIGVGVVALGQFPEFAQQYRQHLEGGLGELQSVVSRLDEDAAQVQLNREQALRALEQSLEELPQKRGKSMRIAVSRYENLTEQRQAIDEASPLLRPIHVLQYPDPKILTGTWRIFEPALPLTTAGLVWSGIGGFIAWMIARTPVKLWRRRKEKRSNPAHWIRSSS